MRVPRLGPRVLLVLAGLAGGVAPEARAEGPPPGARPLPVERTATVRAEDGPVYYVDGPTVIPKNAEITVQLDVRIIGINGASLEVQGGLKVHGTQDHWVRIDNVDFSPTRAPKKGLHLDMVNLFGCRFVHAEGPPFTGALTIENGTMQRDCAFDVRLGEGFLKLMTIESGIPWTIRCEPSSPKPGTLLVEVRSCWAREIRFSGAASATFRHAEIQGGLTCERVTDLTVDGCDVSPHLAIRQGPEDTFQQVTLTKCNLWEGTLLVLHRDPNEAAKVEKVKVDKFYFGPKEGGAAVTRPDALARLVEDGADEPSRKVEARLVSPADRRHQLVNTTTLRLRVPPVQ